jgi:hypothetical protein
VQPRGESPAILARRADRKVPRDRGKAKGIYPNRVSFYKPNLPASQSPLLNHNRNVRS